MIGSPSAAEDRGQLARRPSEIPRRGWWDVLLRVKDEIGRDNLSIVAAGVAFYALFAVFPAITALVTLWGLVTDPAEVEQQIAPLQDLLPAEAYGILSEQTHAVASQADGTMSVGLVLGVLLAIWGATKGTKAILTAMNIAYEEQESRGFVRLNLVSLAFTVGAVLFVIVALTIIAAVPAAIAVFGSGGLFDAVVLLARWVLMALLMIGALALLFRWGPSREAPKFSWVTPGAVVATILWLLGSVAFSLYVRNFADYNETFGSLGAVVVLLMWFYISAYVVCLGAELNAELEFHTRRDTTTGPEQPPGARGAYVADNAP